MHVRTIQPHEHAMFAALHTHTDDVDSIHGYLQRLLDQRSTRFDWCFVLESGSTLLGRVAYWGPPGSDVPTDVVLLDLPWTTDCLPAGTQLLHETAHRLRQQGATALGYALDLPPRSPQWQRAAIQRHTVLTQVGFTVIRETQRWTWPTTAPHPHPPHRLVFRALPDVGESVFRDVLEHVMRDARDQRAVADRAAYGPAQAAHAFFTICAALGFDPHWWQVAYTATGDVVGISMPAGTAAWATIGYIGVIPAQRGHGYIDELLANATQILATLHPARIEADTDVANTPMANAFRRSGWVAFGTRREYRWYNQP